MSSQEHIDALEWEVLRDGDSERNWLELVRAVEQSDTHTSRTSRINAVSVIYERAVRRLPKSYELWRQYINYRASNITDQCSALEKFQILRHLFERAVELLPTSTALWVDMLELIAAAPSPRVTMMRDMVYRALKALPVAEHHLVWRVVKRWTRSPCVPCSTLKLLWQAYLVFDPTPKAKRQYFHLLVSRGEHDFFLREWVEYFYSCYCTRTGSVQEDHLGPRVLLLHQADMWEAIQNTFEAKEWHYSSDLTALDAVVEYGALKAVEPYQFLRAYALFLCGQGEFTRGRKRLHDLLENAPDPFTFNSLYESAVEMEDETIESFVQHPKLPELSRGQVDALSEAIFGKEAKDCMHYHLQYLATEHDRLFNESQLRNAPQSTPLWLKRMEIAEEALVDGRGSIESVVSLWEQSLNKCTQGAEIVDDLVGQLFLSFASFLLRHGRAEDAKDLLDRGAWKTRFYSASVNALLAGLLVEVEVLTGPPAGPTRWCALATSVVTELKASPHAVRRKRSRLLAEKNTSVELLKSPLLWMLALDIQFSCSSLEEITETIQAWEQSGAFTAEATAYITYRCYQRGEEAAVVRHFEKGLSLSRHSPLCMLFLTSQYISFLCLQHRDHLPIDMFRELSRLVLQEAPKAIVEVPLFTIDVLMNCVSVECVHGLHGMALEMLRTAATIALDHLQASDAHFPLLCGVIETAITLTFQYRGIHAVRSLCNALLQRVSGEPRLLQRVSVHWGALEKRCGFVSNVHTIMDAYAETQDPDVPQGEVYWNIWESYCDSIQEFEALVRRRQQSRVRHSKQKEK